MKNTFLGCGLLILLLSSVSPARLSAQTPDVVIADFRAYSFFNNLVIADSVFYESENPLPGPVEYLEDTLDVFSENGAFALHYAPADSNAFVVIWIDLNENGLFEKEEQIYSGSSQGGLLNDNVTFPAFTGSRRTLVAISENQGNLAEPREILVNDQISSLQFIIRGGPPTLTMGSKKDTRGESENYCLEIPMELYLGPGHPCISIEEWQITYPVSNSATVDTVVNLFGSSMPFAVGTMLYANDYVPFDFDFSSFPINDGDTVNFILQYSLCTDPGILDTVVFSFVKDCTTGTRDPAHQLNEKLQLQIAPNPVQSGTQISFELETPGLVQLALYDLAGRQLDLLQQGYLSAGTHQLIFQPETLPTGTYWLRLATQNGFLSKKMIVLNR